MLGGDSKVCIRSTTPISKLKTAKKVRLVDVSGFARKFEVIDRGVKDSCGERILAVGFLAPFWAEGGGQIGLRCLEQPTWFGRSSVFDRRVDNQQSHVYVCPLLTE